MKRLALALAVPVLLVILPLLLRPSADWSPSAPERLVVITPNSEQIKYEFEQAFRTKVNKNLVKQAMLLEPLFEFSGSCAVCGETAYVRLVSQFCEP